MSRNLADRPGRWRTLRWGVVMLTLAVLATAMASLVLGGHDALLAYRPAERLLGVAVLFAGLANLTAMILVRQGRVGLAALGFAIGSMPGFLLAAVQTGFDQEPRAALWLVASAAPATAAAVMLTRGRRPHGARPSETILSATVAAAATAAVPLVSLFVGAYQPVTDAQVLDVKVHLAVVAERGGPHGERYAVVEMLTDIANIGRKSLVIMGSRYAVIGKKSEPRATPRQDDWPIGGEMAANRWSARFEKPSSEFLIETGFDFVETPFVLDPGQQTQTNFLTYVPVSRANTVWANVVIATAFADRLRLGRLLQDTTDERLDAEHPVHAVWELEPTSWIAALTRRHTLLQMKYSLIATQDPSAPDGPGTFIESHIWSTFGHTRQELNKEYPDNPNMSLFFGANYTETGIQLAIDGTGGS